MWISAWTDGQGELKLGAGSRARKATWESDALMQLSVKVQPGLPPAAFNRMLHLQPPTSCVPLHLAAALMHYSKSVR